ncbi:MAG TPA: phage protein Gp27 family protein [Acidobacteriaceae bacterium]|jgi:hypothetical protein|nr:phage protein Gp27 family protein [Acidobacteriaceae bacterium]
MPKPRPKTGEEREVRRPLKIDLLPQSAKDAIAQLRDRGRTWKEIEEQSGLQYSSKWEKDGQGFIDWDALETRALEEFPELKLPKSSLQRWYDIRMEQVRHQVLVESESARAWAQEFASKNLDGSNSAVINALRDQVFTMMRGVGDMDRAGFVKALQNLTLAMTRMQRVELQQKRVEADIAKLEAERAKLAAEAGDPREIYLLASQDLLKKLRTREGVRAVIDPIKEELIQEFTHGAEAFAKHVEASAA